jgi:hypothetical protein
MCCRSSLKGYRRETPPLISSTRPARSHPGGISRRALGRRPYGCDAAQGRSTFDRLGGTQIVRNEGHFGDIDDPYPSFELLDRLSE